MSYEPNRKQSTQDFYESAMQPDFPDEIALQIDRQQAGEGPEIGYSQESVETISEQFRAFLLARSYAHYKATGFMPKHVRAKVTFDFSPHPGDPMDDPDVGPFYHAANDRGTTMIDGTLRAYSWRKP